LVKTPEEVFNVFNDIPEVDDEVLTSRL